MSGIDGAIGDGDHGVNMNKGFTICKKRLAGEENLSEALQILGDVLLNEIGGSMGPIYGSFFYEMSFVIRDTEEIDSLKFGEMLEKGLEGIQELVSTKLGDKTLLDCLIPARDAYDEALNNGESFHEALLKLKKAAQEGKDKTKNMIAKAGRASRLGERSRGVLDAGAVSCCLILNSICDTVLSFEHSV